MRWHDGEPFTSEDVCFTWQFVASAGSQTYNRDQYLGIVDCLMPDDETVVFRWNDVYGYYAGLFEAILPEHVLGGIRQRRRLSTTHLLIVDWNWSVPDRFVSPNGRVVNTSGLHVILTIGVAKDYPRIDEIVWAFIPDSNTRLNADQNRRL